MSLNKALWLLIAAGEFYILVEMAYWSARFWRDHKKSRALVALGLFVLVGTFTARQVGLVVGPLLIVFAGSAHAWLSWAMIIYLINVIAVIIGMRTLQWTFATEEKNDKAENRS